MGALFNPCTGEMIENPSALFEGERDITGFRQATPDEWQRYVASFTWGSA